MRLKKERGKPEALIFTPAKSTGLLTETNCVRLWNSFYRALDIYSGAKVYRNKIIETALEEGITPHALRHPYGMHTLKSAGFLIANSFYYTR